LPKGTSDALSFRSIQSTAAAAAAACKQGFIYSPDH
jgi:hypothetical protein